MAAQQESPLVKGEIDTSDATIGFGGMKRGGMFSDFLLSSAFLFGLVRCVSTANPPPN